jgi:hypothetical protein
MYLFFPFGEASMVSEKQDGRERVSEREGERERKREIYNCIIT